MIIPHFAEIEFLVILVILIYFLCIRKERRKIEHHEQKRIDQDFKEFVESLPDEYRNPLRSIKIELSDKLVGYCRNKKVIGVYRSKGHKHKITQKDVILHESAHVVNDSTEHDASFWIHHDTLQKYAKDYFHHSY